MTLLAHSPAVSNIVTQFRIHLPRISVIRIEFPSTPPAILTCVIVAFENGPAPRLVSVRVGIFYAFRSNTPFPIVVFVPSELRERFSLSETGSPGLRFPVTLSGTIFVFFDVLEIHRGFEFG